MAKTDPYPMRFDKFLSEVAEMPYKEVGQYIKLMAIYHQRGVISDNIMAKALPSVSALFKKEEDGWHHSGMRATIQRQKEVPMSEEEKSLYEEVLSIAREQFGHERMQGTKAAKSHFRARLREGATLADFKYAIYGICNDEYHKESGFKHATMEFLCRESMLQKWAVNGRALAKENKTKSNLPSERKA